MPPPRTHAGAVETAQRVAAVWAPGTSDSDPGRTSWVTFRPPDHGQL